MKESVIERAITFKPTRPFRYVNYNRNRNRSYSTVTCMQVEEQRRPRRCSRLRSIIKYSRIESQRHPYEVLSRKIRIVFPTHKSHILYAFYLVYNNKRVGIEFDGTMLPGNKFTWRFTDVNRATYISRDRTYNYPVSIAGPAFPRGAANIWRTRAIRRRRLEPAYGNESCPGVSACGQRFLRTQHSHDESARGCRIG